jgi:hypothetical protein
MKKQCILVGILAGALYAGDAQAQHKTPNQQPPQAGEPTNPTSEPLVLGTVRVPKGVSADGKPLPPGNYQVRLTPQEASPAAVGVSETLERWVEFLQGGSVKAREVASVVPAAETKLVSKDAPPAANGVKIQTLKGNEYVRLWFNKGGNHYLVYLAIQGAASGI